MTFAHTSLRVQTPAVVDELRLLVVDLAELAEGIPGSLDAWELDERLQIPFIPDHGVEGVLNREGYPVQDAVDSNLVGTVNHVVSLADLHVVVVREVGQAHDVVWRAK